MQVALQSIPTAVAAAAAAAPGAQPPHGEAVAVLAMLIPITAIIMGIGLAMLSIYLDFRKKREILTLNHAERMSAIEKGIELPPLLPEVFRDQHDRAYQFNPARARRVGLILTFLGIGFGIALWGTAPRAAWWALVPFALGAAFLLSSRLEAAELTRSNAISAAQEPPR